MVLAAGYSLGTMAFPYATMLVNHQLAAALAWIAFAMTEMALMDGKSPRAAISPWRWLGVGHLLGWAAISDYATLAITAILGVRVGWAQRRLAPGLWFAVGFAPPIAAFLAYNQFAFGGPLRLGYQREEHAVWQDLAGQAIGFSLPQLTVVGQLLAGRYRGLLWGTPFLVCLLPLAVFALWRARRRQWPWRAWACSAVLISLAFLGYNAGFIYWHGGYAAGPRFLIPALPFMVSLLATLPAAWRSLAAWLVGIAIVQMLATTAVNPQVPGGHHPWLHPHPYVSPALQHYQDPWFDYTWPRLLAGKLGCNTQGLADIVPREPHDPLGERAAFNWGERWGLRGHAALLPLLVWWWVVGCGCWAMVSRARRCSAIAGVVAGS
jgi:hypothetical protein